MHNALSQTHKRPPTGELPLGFFACPNPDCEAFNRFGGDSLLVAEHMGKDKTLRRLYCRRCTTRLSERQGSLMEYSKLPPACRRVDRGGTRSEDFHRLSLEPLQEPLEAVQMDGLHGRMAEEDGEERGRLRGVVAWVARGLIRSWT